MFFFYIGDFSTDVVIAYHTAGPVMMFLWMSLHFPDGPGIQSTIHLKQNIHGPFYAVALLEFHFSFINIDAVCLLAYFRRFFELNLQNWLWFVAVLCVSPSTACLSLILFFFIFTRGLWLFPYLYYWCVSGLLWNPSFASAFHCDFPSLGTSWIKM